VPLRLADGRLTYGRQTVELAAVQGIQYGVESTQLYRFAIGRTYSLRLRTADHTLAIRLREYAGISAAYFEELYLELVKLVWQATAGHLATGMVEDLLADRAVRVGACTFTRQGLRYKGREAGWDELSYRVNYNRLTIDHRHNSRFWADLYYDREFNVPILAMVLDWVYEQGGLAQLQAG
jgi:hypothetical protein